MLSSDDGMVIKKVFAGKNIWGCWMGLVREVTRVFVDEHGTPHKVCGAQSRGLIWIMEIAMSK